jgi:hypothetical protein
LRFTVPKLLAAGSILMVAALLLGGPLAEGMFAVAAVLFPVALIALGTRRLWPRLRAVLAVLGVIVTLSAIGILLLPTTVSAGGLLLGLPPAAWLALAGLGLVPFVLVVWSHAATFDPTGTDPTGRSLDSDRGHG